MNTHLKAKIKYIYSPLKVVKNFEYLHSSLEGQAVSMFWDSIHMLNTKERNVQTNRAGT